MTDNVCMTSWALDLAVEPASALTNVVNAAAIHCSRQLTDWCDFWRSATSLSFLTGTCLFLHNSSTSWVFVLRPAPKLGRMTTCWRDAMVNVHATLTSEAIHQQTTHVVLDRRLHIIRHDTYVRSATGDVTPMMTLLSIDAVSAWRQSSDGRHVMKSPDGDMATLMKSTPDRHKHLLVCGVHYRCRE